MKYKTKSAFVKYFNTLSWYCINMDFNSNNPYYINVLSSINGEELFKRLTYSGSKPNKYNSISSLDEFVDFCRGQLSYYFRGNADFEMSLGSLHSHDLDSCYKLSVYDQVEPNLHLIINYLIHSLELDFPLLSGPVEFHGGISFYAR